MKYILKLISWVAVLAVGGGAIAGVNAISKAF